MDKRSFVSYLMKYDKYTDFIEHSGVSGMSWYHHDPKRRQQGEKAYKKGRNTEGFIVKSLSEYVKKKIEEDYKNEDGSVGGFTDILDKAKKKAKSAKKKVDKAVDVVSEKETTIVNKINRKKDRKKADKVREIDKETGLYLKNFDFTEDEDMALVNPDLKYSKKLGVYFGDKEYSMNCVSCSMAYEMRRRGYDVEAVPSKKARGRWATEYENAFHNTERGTLYNMNLNYGRGRYDYRSQHVQNYSQYTGNDDSWIDKSLDKLRSQGEGASGILTIRMWSGGGHALHYSVKNGDVVITDAQINERYTDPVSYLSGLSYSASYFRLDNATINPEKITNFVRNRD